MRVLVACEESGTIRDAFQRRGHDAWSCDLEPSRGDARFVKFHYRENILKLLARIPEWDLMIAHPPCTYTSVSGARWLYDPRPQFANRSKQRRDAIDFFKFLDRFESIPRRALEHPISVVSTHYRKPDQTVRPHWFGHKETKAICLYLTELPLLEKTDYIEPPEGPAYKWSMKDKAEWNQVHRMPPGPNRARDRAKTCVGFAEAMVDQWGGLK